MFDLRARHHAAKQRTAALIFDHKGDTVDKPLVHIIVRHSCYNAVQISCDHRASLPKQCEPGFYLLSICLKLV